MQEFSSISVSSYEAGSLAERLTEQSSDGWAVVAIVPTGSTITAYLSRAAGDGAESASAPAAATASAAMLVGDEAAATVATPGETPDAPTTPDVSAPDANDADASGTDTTAPEADPITEAAGWASSTTAEPAAAPEVAATPSAPSGAADAAAPAGGAAPAGWYADPSSRFELRYWDGSQWTEHVSRAGQQYTDPPVA